jgi:transposase
MADAAGLRCDGLTAPCVLDGPINGEKFLAYVERVLTPTLSPGDIVIMDNLGAHKIAGVRQVFEAAGASQPLLPAYSPSPPAVKAASFNRWSPHNL